MPRKIVTVQDLQDKKDKEFIENNKLDTSKAFSKRLKEINDGQKPNDNLKNEDGTVFMDNDPETNTIVTVPNRRLLYREKEISSEFDREMIQLVTKKEKKIEAPTPIEEVPPPKPPSGLVVSCAGAIWPIPGTGTQERDLPYYRKNRYPGGNNIDGGYLWGKGDHVLFYVYDLQPAADRATFNYEWKVNGKVICDTPYMSMYNTMNPDKVENWRDAKDIKVQCRVWNDQGEEKVTVRARCADRVIGGSAERNPGKDPGWKYRGFYYEFDPKRFYEEKKRGSIQQVQDKRYMPRPVRLNTITFEDAGIHSHTPWSSYSGRPHHRRFYLPHSWWEKHWGHAFSFGIFMNGQKVNAEEFWSGVPGVKNPWSALNFTRRVDLGKLRGKYGRVIDAREYRDFRNKMRTQEGRAQFLEEGIIRPSLNEIKNKFVEFPVAGGDDYKYEATYGHWYGTSYWHHGFNWYHGIREGTVPMEEEVEKVYVPELVLKRYRLSWGQVAKIIKMVRKDKNMKYFKDGARKVLGY